MFLLLFVPVRGSRYLESASWLVVSPSRSFRAVLQRAYRILVPRLKLNITHRMEAQNHAFGLPGSPKFDCDTLGCTFNLSKSCDFCLCHSCFSPRLKLDYPLPHSRLFPFVTMTPTPLLLCMKICQVMGG